MRLIYTALISTISASFAFWAGRLIEEKSPQPSFVVTECGIGYSSERPPAEDIDKISAEAHAKFATRIKGNRLTRDVIVSPGAGNEIKISIHSIEPLHDCCFSRIESDIVDFVMNRADHYAALREEMKKSEATNPENATHFPQIAPSLEKPRTPKPR